MWVTIRDVLMSPNVTIILCFLAFFIVVGVGLTKSGLLTVHTKNVQFGAADRERDIIRQQIEWVRLHCEGLEASIVKPENYDSWRGKYIAERVYDEYVDWITFNHLSNSDAYVEIKQDKILNLVHSLTVHAMFSSEEFDEMLRNDIKHCIKRLIQIRELYNK